MLCCYGRRGVHRSTDNQFLADVNPVGIRDRIPGQQVRRADPVHPCDSIDAVAGAYDVGIAVSGRQTVSLGESNRPCPIAPGQPQHLAFANEISAPEIVDLNQGVLTDPVARRNSGNGLAALDPVQHVRALRRIAQRGGNSGHPAGRVGSDVRRNTQPESAWHEFLFAPDRRSQRGIPATEQSVTDVESVRQGGHGDEVGYIHHQGIGLRIGIQWAEILLRVGIDIHGRKKRHVEITRSKPEQTAVVFPQNDFDAVGPGSCARRCACRPGRGCRR